MAARPEDSGHRRPGAAGLAGDDALAQLLPPCRECWRSADYRRHGDSVPRNAVADLHRQVVLWHLPVALPHRQGVESPADGVAAHVDGGHRHVRCSCGAVPSHHRSVRTALSGKWRQGD